MSESILKLLIKCLIFSLVLVLVVWVLGMILIPDLFIPNPWAWFSSSVLCVVVGFVLMTILSTQEPVEDEHLPRGDSSGGDTNV